MSPWPAPSSCLSIAMVIFHYRHHHRHDQKVAHMDFRARGITYQQLMGFLLPLTLTSTKVSTIKRITFLVYIRFIITYKYNTTLVTSRHGICQMFYTSKIKKKSILPKKMSKLRHFWQNFKNVGCFTHLFLLNCQSFLQIPTLILCHTS